MEDYNDGKWHGWNGGECPVHPLTKVQVIFDDASGSRERCAGDYSWDYPFAQPVAFRVVKEHREPKVWWRVGKHLHETEAESKQFLSELKRDNPGLSFDEWEVVRVVEADE